MNRRSRSPSRFSPIDEHPTSAKHSPKSNASQEGLNKFGGSLHLDVNSPIGQESGNKRPDGAVIIPVIQEKSTHDTPMMSSHRPQSISSHNTPMMPKKPFPDDAKGYEKHDIQTKYHTERSTWPVPVAYSYPYPPYYPDYSYGNYFQSPQQRAYHMYYPSRDYSDTLRHTLRSQGYGTGGRGLDTMKSEKKQKHGTLPSKSGSKSRQQQYGTYRSGQYRPQKERVYKRIHFCCFSCIWPPYAVEDCDPPMAMYPSTPKIQHRRR